MDQPGYDYHIDIPGTTIFDGRQAMKGYALNKMCYSFNQAVNREAFKDDPEIQSWSPDDHARMKRITLRLRKKADA